MATDKSGAAAGEPRALRRFLIVDSHEPARRSLSQMIERRPGWCVAGEAACAFDGLSSARERRPDVVVIDLQLRQADGLEFTRNLVAIAPDVRVVGYSFLDDRLSVSRFLEAGGHAFVSEEEPTDALIEAIDQALAGRIRLAFRDASANEGTADGNSALRLAHCPSPEPGSARNDSSSRRPGAASICKSLQGRPDTSETCG